MDTFAARKHSVRVAVLILVVAACDREQPVSPQQGERRPGSPYAMVGDECQQTCSIITNAIPLRAAAIPSDTAGLTVELGRFEVAGAVGSTVSLSLEIDTTLYSRAQRATRAVLVTVDGVSTRYSYAQAMNGVVVYRFSGKKTVTVRYALPRESGPIPRGRIELVQNIDTRSQIVSSHRPWISRAMMTSIASSPKSTFSVIGPGSYYGVDVAFYDYYPGNPFGEFQSPSGTGASVPIRIEFSAPVRNVTVCIADPDFAGNTLTVNTVSGASNTYGFIGDGTPGTYTQFCIPTTDTQVISILLNPAAADYVAYFGLDFEPGNTSVDVTCAPQPLDRGEAITCTVRAVDPSATLVVTGWSFTSETGVRVDRIANTTSTTWPGSLVVGGSILVEGTVGGVASTGSANVQVRARSWSGRVTQKNHTVIPTTLTSRPTGFGQLGLATLELVGDPGTDRWLKAITDGGPNQDFAYLLDLPPITKTVTQVNTNAINDTSSFYRAQEKTTKKIKGALYCGQSVVTGVLFGLSQKHEGAVPDPDVYPNSHAAIFRRHVDTVAVKRYEPLLGLGDIPGLSTVTNQIFAEGSADSEAMHTDGRNNITTITLGGCDQFHFTYSK